MLYYVFDEGGRLDQVIELPGLSTADPEIRQRIHRGWSYTVVEDSVLWGPAATQLPGHCAFDGEEIVVDDEDRIRAELCRQQGEIIDQQEAQVGAELAGLDWLQEHRGSLTTGQVQLRANGRTQLEILSRARERLARGEVEIPRSLREVAGRRFPIVEALSC